MPMPASLVFNWDLLPPFWDKMGLIAHGFHLGDINHSMDTNDIRNEAAERAYRSCKGSWKSEEYFLKIFTCCAEHVVVDRARKRARRAKEVPMGDEASRRAFREATAPRIETMREALGELEDRNEDWAMVVTSVHFVGEDLATIAARRGVHVDTIGDWKKYGLMALREIIRQIEAGTLIPKKRREARHAAAR